MERAAGLDETEQRPSPPVGWGFLGAGGVARRQMLPAVAREPWVRVAAVMVREQSRAAAIGREFGAQAAYDSVPGLLNDPQVEAVYVATPPACHEAQVVAACESGKAVLLEKPMATDLPAARRMQDAAAAAGVLFAVCFPLRHTAAAREMKRLAEAGWFGDLVLLRGQMVKWYPLDESAWRADPAQAGGGVLSDLGSHLLDWVRWLAGEAESLTATVAKRVWPVAVEDTALVQVQLACGAMASLELGFSVGVAHQALEIYGTRGAAWWRGGRLVLETAAGAEERELPARNVYREELLDFSAALRAGRPAATTGLDGERNVAQLRAAYRAASEGCRVAVSRGR